MVDLAEKSNASKAQDIQKTSGPVVIKIDARISDIVNSYLEHRRQDLSGLHAALNSGGFEHIQQVGHDLFGTGGSFGFEGLSIIGCSMESAAKNHESEEISLLIEGLAEYLSSVEVVHR